MKTKIATAALLLNSDGPHITDERTMTDIVGPDHSNAIAFPPFVYAAGIVAGVGLDILWPVPILPDAVQFAVGGTVLCISGAIMPFVIRRFRKSRTTFSVRGSSSALITDGPYRFSRNPSYVSLTLLYVAISVLADNIWMLALLVPVLLVMQFGVVMREERYLERKFGDEYRRYKGLVRRWI